jgi:hypothetical protein
VDIAVKEHAYISAIIVALIGGLILAVGLYWERVKLRLSPVLYASLHKMGNDARWWFAVLVVLLLAIRAPATIHELRGNGSATITGTIGVPAGSFDATIPVPASLPYEIRSVTPDWNDSGHVIVSKADGQFKVRFEYPPPPGGGELDWEIIPRAGSQEIVAVIPTETPNPTTAPTPVPTVEQFRHGGYPMQVIISYLQKWPRPGEHDVSIVATEESHDIAKTMVDTVRAGSAAGQVWVVKEHGQGSGVFIGNPTDYALDDGITVRAHVDSADAEELRAALLIAGFDPAQIKRAISPQTDGHDYVSLEIGNFPSK